MASLHRRLCRKHQNMAVFTSTMDRRALVDGSTICGAALKRSELVTVIAPWPRLQKNIRNYRPREVSDTHKQTTRVPDLREVNFTSPSGQCSHSAQKETPASVSVQKEKKKRGLQSSQASRTTRLLSALVLQWKDKKPSNVRLPPFSTSALESAVAVDFAPAGGAGIAKEGHLP